MEPKPDRFFVWDFKEIVILLLLAGVIALFSFTLGLHLGKRINKTDGSSHVEIGEDHSPKKIETIEDKTPSRSELQESEKTVEGESETLLDESLQGEVAKSGIKLKDPKPVTLPSDKKSTPAQHPAQVTTGEMLYSIQVGSFPTAEDAAQTVQTLHAEGLTNASVKEVEVPKVGKRYRVVVGSFKTKKEATDAGENYRGKSWIKSFVIVRSGGSKE